MGLSAGDATFGLPEQPPPGSPKSAGSLSLGENRVYFGLWCFARLAT